MIKRLNLVLDGWGRYFKCGYPERPFYDRIGIVALDMARAAGCRQSILSALRQDFLDEQTREYGVDGYFERVCGSNNLHGASKVVRAREFLAELRSRGEGVFVWYNMRYEADSCEDRIRHGTQDARERARGDIRAGGFGKCFGHSLGHGVGLEIHEAPYASKKSDWTLKPGMFVTIEPGIYLEGNLGVRIEDLVLVTETGCEVLTEKAKEDK